MYLTNRHYECEKCLKAVTIQYLPPVCSGRRFVRRLIDIAAAMLGLSDRTTAVPMSFALQSACSGAPCTMSAAAARQINNLQRSAAQCYVEIDAALLR